MDAAQVLRSARSRSGLGARALARVAGTSHATLLAYESGAKIPRIDTLERILRATGVATDLAVSARADASPDERAAKGKELIEVLHLAAQFPARHSTHIGCPVFGGT
jgi:transcriptional regulator with XRE-family HTH domain